MSGGIITKFSKKARKFLRRQRDRLSGDQGEMQGSRSSEFRMDQEGGREDTQKYICLHRLSLLVIWVSGRICFFSFFYPADKRLFNSNY